jgi:hypothetical protein
MVIIGPGVLLERVLPVQVLKREIPITFIRSRRVTRTLKQYLIQILLRLVYYPFRVLQSIDRMILILLTIDVLRYLFLVRK